MEAGGVGDFGPATIDFLGNQHAADALSPWSPSSYPYGTHEVLDLSTSIECQYVLLLLKLHAVGGCTSSIFAVYVFNDSSSHKTCVMKHQAFSAALCKR